MRTNVWIPDHTRRRLERRFGRSANLSGLVTLGLELLLQSAEREPAAGAAAKLMSELAKAAERAESKPHARVGAAPRKRVRS